MGSFLEILEDRVNAGAHLMVKGGAAVENVLGRLFGPVLEHIGSLRDDLKNVAEEAASTEQEQKNYPSIKWSDLTNVAKIFIGKQRQEQIEELGGDDPPINPEEQDAEKHLVIGGASVAAVALGLGHPVLLIAGGAGLLYQASFTFREGYRAVVHDRRVNIYAYNSLMIIGAIFSGSILTLTIGTFFTSGLRWILAKTEGVAERSVSSVFGRQPRFAWILVDEAEVQVPFEQVHVGDIIISSSGEMILVDGVLVKGMASIDRKLLTGEAQLVDIGPGDRVLASSVVQRGKIYIRVERSGNDTVAAQVARAQADTSEFKKALSTRAEAELNHLAIPFLALGALALPLWGVSSALAILWIIPGYRMMFFGPLTMLTFMHVASHHGILLKNGRVLERLREIDTVVFDKTGTLTEEQPTVGRIFCFTDLAEEEVLMLAVMAEHAQTHPVALAIQQLAQRRGVSPQLVERPEVSIGLGVSVTVAGQEILVGSDRLMAISKVDLPEEAVRQQAYVHRQGHSLVFIARAGMLVGAIEICPSIRPEAEKLIAELHRRGKQVLVVSGDHTEPTRALSAKLGIERYFAQVLPNDKSKIVEQLRREGRKVCFIGDGINDSIALSKADVSISMMGAASVATTVSQVVLMSGNLEQVNFLFDVGDSFEHYMRINRIATNLPAYIAAGGVFAFGWGYAASVVISQLSTPVAAYSLLHPVAKYKA